MAVSDTLINTLFDGRYRILRKLGSGGMANVYLAEDEDLGRRVAIKILNERYATDYPAQVGPHMTNTDSAPFQDIIAAISLRENERGRDIGAGWDPHWHQPTDLYSTFSDKDFRLGLNDAQTTLGA